ncbi:hypothetical protein [Halanaeroarchaeum sulfurireducens]|uniref:Uncharacterized protein n=1 Tax=Halanaeroarchaeum sulfurireducens TaxID=1604004 RepID=A0A0F7PF50_9EURY|nr:hypothetical protein [Halanaeroarchaeum sulfurireducens]AKH98149.1 hypothetical protein HLASF_1673 [Halanaeroarchaeum sulfurireducens]ALG82543.1 hypothetical protein HLASA_1660 [Halanaeroarchaeum sulfurireducens]
MARSGELDTVLDDRRINAAVGWGLLAFVAAGALESIADGDWVWVLVSGSVVVLALLPALIYRSPRVMVPWEVLVLATLPMLARSLTGPGTFGQIAAYLAVAAVALIIAVELDVFTPVRMTTTFAVVFVVIATIATAGVWAIVQWASDLYFGTTFIYPMSPPVSRAVDDAALESLMWDFVVATAAGLLGGLVFALYFRERANTRIEPLDEGADVDR